MRTTLIGTVLALAVALPIAGICAPAQEAPAEIAPTAQELYDTLEEEVEATTKAWYAELREKRRIAKENGEELPDSAYVRPYGPFVVKFQAAAARYVGTDDAVRFLLWLVQTGMDVDEDAGKSALETLLDTHRKSEELGPLASWLPELGDYLDGDVAAKYVALLEQESPLPGIVGYAVYARLKPVLEGADLDSTEYAAAKTEMLAAIEKAENRRLDRTVRSELGIREQFSMGMVVPDIEGIDLDGEAFKLSDYQGKILFVDFWGDW